MTAESHTLSAFYGTDSIGWHAFCSCSLRVEGASKDEVREAHQRHVGALATKPGVTKARQALAASLERGKPEPAEVAQ